MIRRLCGSLLAQPDRLAGLLFTLIGAGFCAGSGAYVVGTAEQMGPGYFPRMLGGLLAVLGIVIFVTAKGGSPASSPGRLPWRPFVAICAGIALFALTLNSGGLFIASVLLIAISSLGQGGRRWNEILLSSLILAIVACLVFVQGLKLTVPVLPALPGLARFF